MNLFLGIVSLVLTFSLVVIVEKIFKKEGLYVWIAISTITANILVCKSIEIIGITTNLGIVMFASTFLATDIMSEKYGSKESRKAIILGVVSEVIFITMTMLALKYEPSSIDMSSESMKNLFSINFRVSISSIAMFLISSLLDIYLFEKIKKKYPNKLWLRNNVATMISNSVENYFFIFFAFVGLYDIGSMLTMATFASLIEIIIAALDTPFLYLAKLDIKNVFKFDNATNYSN
ncbi:MAG: queuosine precursor transporter [Clostridia bacterium]|nr:queuosine precursor transporter [Clostridia bacterium]